MPVGRSMVNNAQRSGKDPKGVKVWLRNHVLAIAPAPGLSNAQLHPCASVLQDAHRYASFSSFASLHKKPNLRSISIRFYVPS